MKMLTTMEEKGNGRREKLNMRWIDSIREPTTLNFQELSRAANDKTFWRLLIHRVVIKSETT